MLYIGHTNEKIEHTNELQALEIVSLTVVDFWKRALLSNSSPKHAVMSALSKAGRTYFSNKSGTLAFIV